jgi:RHS repeat-associated protein
VDWFITDHLGSTKLLIDQNGQHRFTRDDDPFGINLKSFEDKDSHRYTGQILDEEQGVYYGARYYLPEIGRFLSTDPLKEFPSIYIYTGSNPIRFLDKDGKLTGDSQDLPPKAKQYEEMMGRVASVEKAPIITPIKQIKDPVAVDKMLVDWAQSRSTEANASGLFANLFLASYNADNGNYGQAGLILLRAGLIKDRKFKAPHSDRSLGEVALV